MRILRLNLASVGKRWISDVCCGYRMVRIQLFAIPSSLTVHHSVTDSLVFSFERVGSWVHFGFLDGLSDSQKRLIIWLETWPKVPRGPGWPGRALRPIVVRNQDVVWGALWVLRP